MARDTKQPGMCGCTRSPRGSLYRRLLREIAAADLPSRPRPAPAVTEADLEGLPGAARRYMRFMGVVGQPW